MKKVYEVTIKATIIKYIEVEAESENEAEEKANELFNILCDNSLEHYTQNVINIETIPPRTK
jgi:nicotinate-nucleotide pyrophosphorylase